MLRTTDAWLVRLRSCAALSHALNDAMQPAFGRGLIQSKTDPTTTQKGREIAAALQEWGDKPLRGL
jgi:hypothetical protein